MDPKPIPAFYCCYLLRSTRSARATYIGSTPHPSRRLAQHNGDSPGGAVRTAREKLRPWEMTVIVTGFPSRIAALQFEWAWQNAHITTKISKDQRITFPPNNPSKRNQQPQYSLTGRLKNLHLLLQMPSFVRWPLHIRFFCKDVYARWHTWTERVSASVDSHTKVILDLKQPARVDEDDEIPQGSQAKGKWKLEKLGNDGVDVGYGALKGHLEKIISLLAKDKMVDCAVCRKSMGLASKMALVCPQDGCRSASHIGCLATKFLQDSSEIMSIVPISGTCPVCKAELRWIDLIKEMSLRVRGDKEVAQLMKKTRTRKANVDKTAMLPASRADAKGLESGASDGGDDDANPVADEVEGSLADNWYYQEDDDDMMSVTSVASGYSDSIEAPSPNKSSSTAPWLKAVIEDSEWDDAEVLD